MALRLVGLALAAVVVGFLWIRGCSGPDPVVADVRLIEPRAEATPYRVEATVRNQGLGDGEVQVSFRLRDRGSGRIVHDEKKISLGRDETALAVVEIPAPPGSYQPEVEANYPPR